ncbi:MULTISPECIES: hypothetical protein [Pseudomonas syringae group]|uniref:hypothetical protein n=1 Tax=Pseudomonas syringae group TaxID=136849 RepID=UPI000E316FD4|nr:MULTISPECIES: hypothetical protein [Pseudomonas syringae group]
MAGEISVTFGFYFCVEPQSLDGKQTSSLYDLVEPIDKNLSECFTQAEDENTSRHSYGSSGWFGKEMSGTGNLSSGDRWADFKVRNGDFEALKKEYQRFIEDDNVIQLKALMDEHYGPDSYEIRLGSFAGQSF